MKALRELTLEDLTQYPIWRYDGDSDDTASVWPVETFGQSDCGTYIARTRFVLADGTEWWGYCSPTDDSGLDYIQPVILAPGGPVRLYYDEPPVEPEPGRTCRLLGRSFAQIFPLRFECVVPVEGRLVAGELAMVAVPAEPGAAPDRGGHIV